MDGVGAALPGHLDDRVDLQVAVARRVGTDGPGFVGQADVQGGTIALAVDRHRGDAHVAARPDDAHGDLAAVGDQNSW